MDLPLQFISVPQRDFVQSHIRNECFSGGYGNGKSVGGCIKIQLLMAQFPGYRVAICRKRFSDLKRTTMSTFFKNCPPALYDPRKGGKRTDSLGELRFINGSMIFWLHLEDYDDSVVRGLEVNSVLVDQAEEISEHIYLHLSARVGRWDRAIVPEGMSTTNLARHKLTGEPVPPAYMLLLCNPDTKDHWIYKRYHPESPEWKDKYYKNHIMFQSASTDNKLLDEELIDEMSNRGKQFSERFVQGIWGNSGGTIHDLHPGSILYPDQIPEGFLEQILDEGRLIRVMDHGDTSPTCVVWFCLWKEYIFAYREYYRPKELISNHRRNIAELSINPFTGRHEQYAIDLADPSIFKKSGQKMGGYYTVAEEYTDAAYNDDGIVDGSMTSLAPPIFWNPADNSEFLCRSRLNELLKPREGLKHPFLEDLDVSPSLFFIHKNDNYSNGCYNAIYELINQKYKKIDNVDGNDIFSDGRDPGGVDHAYDVVRYMSGYYHQILKEENTQMPQGSFMAYRNNIKKQNKRRRWLN